MRLTRLRRIWRSKVCQLILLLAAIMAVYANGYSTTDRFSGSHNTLENQVKAVNPLQVCYYHISDDNGTKPKASTDVILLFEPAGKALLYVQSPNDMLAYHGTWQFDQGRMRISFKTHDLNVDTAFPFDLNQSEATMPFRVLSDGKGSSKWKRRIVRVEHAVNIVFRGNVIDKMQPLKPDEAIGRAVEFANAVIAVYHKRETNSNLNFSTGGLKNIFKPIRLVPPLYAKSDIPWLLHKWVKFIPVQTKRLRNGITFIYMDGSETDVLFFSWTPSPPTDPLKLHLSRLAYDPRHQINAKPSGNTRFDPTYKTALYISPFETGRLISGIHETGKEFDWRLTEKKLEENGYKISIVERVRDEAVTVERIIKRLVDMKEPGVVVIHTHGTESGALATGELLTDDINKVDEKFEEVKKRLKDRGHGRLVEMNGIGKMSLPETTDYVVTIKPPFWEYVQSISYLPVSFKKSFFYVSACYTDSTPDLRKAVRAGTYFAWKSQTSPSLSGAFLYYLISNLARPTHSAEEAYYNLVRVVNTRQMIFKEDKILDGKVPSVRPRNGGQVSIFPTKFDEYQFNGYGYNGRDLIRYAGSGWLSPEFVDVGQVWWLMFAGRWGQDARQGAENIKNCYNTYWKKKELGRLKSVFCNTANNGKPPRKDEVAYAIYLLTGDKDMSFSGTYVPRWTLNETR